MAVHINNPSILVLASGFEDGELVQAMKLPVALPLVGRFLWDNDVSRVSGGWDVYVVLLIYFVLWIVRLTGISNNVPVVIPTVFPI